MRRPDLLGMMTRPVPRRRPPRVDAERLGRVLIVRLSSLGDVVQTLPVAVALRRRHPHLRIDWAVEDWAAPVLEGHRAIDRVVRLPKLAAGALASRRGEWIGALRHAVAELRRERYDVVFDLQGLLKSSIVALVSGAGSRIGIEGQREGSHLVSSTIPFSGKRLHAVEEYLHAAAFLGAPVDPVAFDLEPRPEARASVAAMLASLELPVGAPLVVACPSASRAQKSWPAERWAEVADAIGDVAAVVLAGDRGHAELHADIARRARRPLRNLTGRTSLAELIALLDRAAVVIAPDTGPAHVAAALGRPAVGLYGPTAPERLAPWGARARVIHHRELCRATCPGFCPRRRCLEAITVAEAAAAVREVLAAK